MMQQQQSSVVALEGTDPVLVGLVSNRLHSMLDEQQAALVNTAFSPVVRESYDLACAVFDSRGSMIGQSSGGTPGHINALATGMRHIASRYPAQSMAEGDVLITNDPWMTAGQINDITVATPVFRNHVLVAWFASCCHSPDIGGRILSAAATEVYEEGLRIPILKLRTAEGPNEVLEEIIRVNVRTPDETLGDIYAQVAANQVGARSLLRLMDEYQLDSIDDVAAEIMDRSEAALRNAIEQLTDGTYTAAMECDGFGGQPLTLQVTVTVRGNGITVDYAGSSPQSPFGVNVVLNYTRAYTSFAIKAALAPEVPHNAGSFRPVHITAPEGSVLNCLDPAPVASRHLVGHFLPSLVFEALRPALPEGLPAASADALWMSVWRGNGTTKDESFTLTVFGAGGSGGRPTKDGLTTTGFPTGVRAAPTEVLETLTPLVQTQRELLPDSGGPGKFRGGLGQQLQVRRRGGQAWTVNANIDRVDHPAAGALGGMPGSAGSFTDIQTGEDLPRKSLLRLAPDTHVRFRFPGGGGYQDPFERDIEDVFNDVVNGYISLEAARGMYGVAIEYLGRPDATVRLPESFRIDRNATRTLRGERQ
ncbi:hydantoinase B/oxoprolinase family protein [Arthrobacter sp. VKM Ac-2550]|uniref:hydantoinase B/oxoprolinase family protein n=1 Tax=Crystallibacter permensis TaxID=1938888 RepID=UPI0022273563|nr:hydantoinase B/oxoprolinase family protein [Arthrobacter sp. VKM Ac-2550]MCW2130865.1 N-methylhydantoinase B [Arthrobacter sp. VKM Ac-2550]